MDVLFFEKLGVYCLQATSEAEFCEQITKICHTLPPEQKKITGKDIEQELDLLCKYMNKKHNKIV